MKDTGYLLLEHSCNNVVLPPPWVQWTVLSFVWQSVMCLHLESQRRSAYQAKWVVRPIPSQSLQCRRIWHYDLTLISVLFSISRWIGLYLLNRMASPMRTSASRSLLTSTWNFCFMLAWAWEIKSYTPSKMKNCYSCCIIADSGKIFIRQRSRGHDEEFLSICVIVLWSTRLFSRTLVDLLVSNAGVSHFVSHALFSTMRHLHHASVLLTNQLILWPPLEVSQRRITMRSFSLP